MRERAGSVASLRAIRRALCAPFHAQRAGEACKSLFQALEIRGRIGILRLTPITRDRRMSWLDIYLVVLFLALVGLLVVKFRG